MSTNKTTVADNFQNIYSKIDQFSCIFLNIRSLRTNFFPFLAAINHLLDSIQIIILVETNISDEEEKFFNIRSFKSIFFNRKHRRGGGIAIFIKESQSYEVSFPQYKTFESILVLTTIQNEDYKMLALYRPPTSANTRPFCKELSELINLQEKPNNLIIAGDFNIDILKNNCYVTEYLDLISSKGLKICNEYEFTRIDDSKKSKTNIDHILIRSRKESKQISSIIVRSDISDHFPIHFSITSSSLALMKKKSFEFQVLNESKLSSKMNDTNWNKLMIETDTENIYDQICKQFDEIYKDSYELKKNVRKNKHNPWFNNEILYLCKKRDHLHKLWLKQGKSKTLEREYKTFRNQTNKKIIWARNEYYKNKLDDCEKDARKTWSVINEILGKKTANIDEDLVKNMKTNDALQLANKFAEEFNLNVQKAIHNCTEVTRHSEATGSCSNSIFLGEVSEEDVYNVLGQLNTRKGPGLDFIRAKELKNHRDILYPLITFLINSIIRQKTIPNAMKTAMVRPIFKAGKKTDITNYRPISIMPSLEKVFEEILCCRLNDFIKKFEIIDNRQYGYQKGKNMNLLLGNFANLLNINLSKNLHTFVLFLDFTKAFDTIPHAKLLDQMEKIGIRGECYQLFENYLKCRTMVVKIQNKISEAHEVEYGVPQGSKLGPILFLIFANSLLKTIKTQDVFAYADDTAVAISHRDVHIGARKLQEEIRRIGNWCHDYGLLLNPTKTKIMHIRAPHIRRTNICFTFEDPCPRSTEKNKIKLEIVGTYKYLGIIIDENLKWNQQIDRIRKKLRSVTYILKHLSYCCKKEVLLKVYYALGESYLRYGITAWGSSGKFSNLQKSQNAVLKILANAKVDTLPLKVENIFKLVNLNEYYEKMEYRIPITHEYKTRAKTEGKYQKPKFFNTYGKFSLPCLMPRLLNTLPPELLNVRNKLKRKKLLKNFFTEIERDR